MYDDEGETPGGRSLGKTAKPARSHSSTATVAERSSRVPSTDQINNDDHVHAAVHHNLDVLRSRAAASDARLGAEAGTESEGDDD